MSNILTVALVSYAEMVMEGRARHKGNKAMEERIGQMRPLLATVNGILSAREDFADAEKCQLIELPSTVFDDICKAITEDIADDIGNPTEQRGRLRIPD